MSALIGIDQSPTGTAVVEICPDGSVARTMFYADTTRAADEHASAGALPPMKVRAGDEVAGTKRLCALRDALTAFVDAAQPPVAAALEGYAFARQAFSHSLGEVGGVVRMVLWDSSVSFRVYDPQAVKIFATGKGNAKKPEMVDAVKYKWGFDASKFGGKPAGASGNLADAYTIARILLTEINVRAGKTTLHSLPEEERRVFLRVTKQNPTNVLDLPFVDRCGGEM